MKLARVRHGDGLRKSVQVRFGGYNALGTEGELCDMENLTSDYYPELASRPKRKLGYQLPEPRGLGSGDELYWADGRDIQYGETLLTNVLEDTEDIRTFVQFGDYLTVWPDKLAIDINDGSVRPMTFQRRWYYMQFRSYTGTYSSKRNRMGFETASILPELPDIRVGDAITVTGNVIYPENNVTAVVREIYRENLSGWGMVFDDYTFTHPNVVRVGLTEAISAGHYYVDIGCTDYGVKLVDVPATESGGRVYFVFREGTVDDYSFADIERVMLKASVNAESAIVLEFRKVASGLETAPAGTTMLPFDSLHRTYDHDYLPDGDWSEYVWSERLTIERAVPDMDVVFAHENRLFGAKGDTIYVSQWGSPFNWNVFDGTASDSFTTETGTPGGFTGGISFGGYPRFFKEDHIFTLYGDYPAEYELVEQRQLGVMAGSGASLAVGDGRLFYLSPRGPCVYAGGEPVRIGDVFGTKRFKNGLGASDDVKYYLDMEDEDGVWHQFVYDIRRGLWMREDGTEAIAMCRYKNDIWRLDADGTAVILGRAEWIPSIARDEDEVEWYAEFGDIAGAAPGKKRVTKLMLRLVLEEGAALRVRMKYDSEDVWRTVAQAAAPSKRSVTLPIIPRRLDHFRLRLEGTGDCRISSLSVEAQAGSDR